VHVAAAVRARAASPIFLEHTAGGGSLAGRCRVRLRLRLRLRVRVKARAKVHPNL